MLHTKSIQLMIVGLALSICLGCGPNDGLSDYERMMQTKETAASSLATSGAKMQEKSYPVGKGWAVDLSGLTITDGLLRQVKQLGNIAELNLSKSSVTDDHLALMYELKLHVVLAKLDLSRTDITDAGLAKLNNGCIFLSELNLTGTKVTPAAVNQFKRNRQSDPVAKIKNTTVRL